MASATALPIKTILFTSSLALSLGASRISLYSKLTSFFTGPGRNSRILAAALLLANFKNIPFVWHYRVWGAILRHMLFNRPDLQPVGAPAALFCPVITSSHSPLYECDYNLHKSNSTYFSDLDPSRSHLVCALLQPGIERLQHNAREKLVLDSEGRAVRGRWGIMLGAVMCSFKREIGMYEPYEMWSRLLCWDRKWIYIVTHFVKKGTTKPKGYILEDGSWFRKKQYKKFEGSGNKDVDDKAIFASAISKYVVKLGRLTIHPEVLLDAAGVLPVKPGGWATMTSKPSGESTPETLEPTNANTARMETIDDIDWKKTETENRRGLEFAQHFAALDNLSQTFSGGKELALGKYRDLMIM